MICFAILASCLSTSATASDGKRSIGSACLPEYARDADYIGRIKGGILKNTNSKSSHVLSVVCPILNDDMSESKTTLNIYYQGEVYCAVFTYTKSGENVYNDSETANSKGKIKSMNLEVREDNSGTMELYCKIYGGSEIISYGWNENI